MKEIANQPSEETSTNASGLIASVKEAFRDSKQRVALISVLAAVFLVSFKLYVGLLTNSLGILSEALHSGLDLVAAVVTMFAVFSSSKPRDEDHHFGHGKVENLSALFEAALLVGTCTWIFYEAYRRIFLTHINVEPSLTGFLIMGISIIIDINRSRMLYAAARKYHSQALEADALHFYSDIFSSAVVIVGLIFVWMGFPIGDPLASAGVGILIMIASLRLGKRTIDALMDQAPVKETEKVKEAISTIEGVRIERIRIRPSGPYTFVDANISVDRRITLEDSRSIVADVEKRVRDVIHGADVIVQVEPRRSPKESLSSKILLIAAKERRISHIHSIRAHKINGSMIINLHMEVDPALNLKEAHDLATAFEERVKSQLGVLEVNTHIEIRELEEPNGSTMSIPQIEERIGDIVARFPEVVGCHNIQATRTEGKVTVNLHCELHGGEPIEKTHEVITMIEGVIKAEIKELSYVYIHVEPTGV